jgi:hypothetical protein
MHFEALEAAAPPALVCVARSLRCDFFMSYDDLSPRVAVFELHGHPLTYLLRLYMPRVHKEVRGLDSLKLSPDPHHLAVGKPIPNPVLAANVCIDIGVDALDVFRPPPLPKLRGLCPGLEQTFRGCADPLAHD